MQLQPAFIEILERTLWLKWACGWAQTAAHFIQSERDIFHKYAFGLDCSLFFPNFGNMAYTLEFDAMKESAAENKNCTKKKQQRKKWRPPTLQLPGRTTLFCPHLIDHISSSTAHPFPHSHTVLVYAWIEFHSVVMLFWSYATVPSLACVSSSAVHIVNWKLSHFRVSCQSSRWFWLHQKQPGIRIWRFRVFVSNI